MAAFHRLILIGSLVLLMAACSKHDTPTTSAASDTGEAEQSREQPEQPRQKGRGLPAGALHAQRVAVMDMNGFGQPLPALFALVPVGWRAQGGVVWGGQFMCTNGYNFNWAAQSPDGLQQVAILPQYKWEANNYGAAPSSPGCNRRFDHFDPAVSRRRRESLSSGARVVDFRPRADLAAKFANLNQATPTAMARCARGWKAGEALFAYQERDAKCAVWWPRPPRFP